MRTHDARVPFHSLRSAMVAGSIMSLAGGAHVLAGGRLPAAGILMALLALTVLASTAATRLRLRSPAMAGLLGTGQLVLHKAFTALDGTLSGPADSAMTHHPVPAMLTAAPLAHIPPDGPVPSLAALMLAGHTLATLTCALLLAKGEEALWLLAAWLRPLFHLPEPALHRIVTASAAAIRPAGRTPRPWRNLRPDCRRGPPFSPVFP